MNLMSLMSFIVFHKMNENMKSLNICCIDLVIEIEKPNEEKIVEEKIEKNIIPKPNLKGKFLIE